MEAANDEQNVWVNTACGKCNRQKNLPKPILWCSNVYSQVASDVWETDNPVHKLATDKPQAVLINVLISEFLNAKVSQGSVATRLRCDEIFSDHSTRQSLLSLLVKEFLKIGQYLAKLWASVDCLVFLTHGLHTVQRRPYRTDIKSWEACRWLAMDGDSRRY